MLMSVRCRFIFLLLVSILMTLSHRELLIMAFMAVLARVSMGFQSRLVATTSIRRMSNNRLYMNSASTINIVTNLRSSDPVDLILKESNYASIRPEEPVSAALEAMTRAKRSSVLVMEDSQIKGIFTERDFINKVLDKSLIASETPISAVMTTDLITVSPSDSIKNCREIMLKNKVRHLPVVNADGCVGVVSMTQIIRAIQKEMTTLESATLFGDTVKEVEQLSKVRANELALLASDNSKQDYVRTGYVAAAAAAGSLLLQAGWVHDHEYLAMSGIFLLGYVGIIFENYFEFNKAAIALLMSAALWTVYADEAGSTGIAAAVGGLTEKLAEVSEVVYFILGAMTIVEIVDAHQGFKVVTDKIDSKNKRGLMTVISVITFFMSAILDNLTTTIVMVSVIKKILPNIDDRKLFGALIVIAANAGGAWTPIGDVTTTMLWINGQISALPTMTNLFLPSFVSTIVPTLMLQQQIPENEPVPESSSEAVPLAPRGSLVFATGVLGLLSVPVFKSLTGLPPYLGMLSALGIMWTLTDAIHAGEREELMAPAALRKIDTSGVLFFLGILMSVGALDAAGILKALAQLLDQSISSDSLLATMIGIASSVIDNVPLVVSHVIIVTIVSILSILSFNDDFECFMF